MLRLSNSRRCRRILLASLVCAAAPWALGEGSAFRPPAVPLVVSDPMLSIWSEADHLTDDNTRHWTHHEHSLVSVIRVDGKAYRLMGKSPANAPALPQVGVQVTPTRSIYDFEGAGVHVNFAFMTPSLPSNLDVLTRPVTYLTWTVRAVDGKEHGVEIYDSTSSQLAVNRTNQNVSWARETMGPLTALRVGTAEQTLLGQAGDDARIDWGYAYAAALTAESKSAIGANDALVEGFVKDGGLPAADDTRMPRAVDDAQPVLAFVFNLGKVSQLGPVTRHLLLGYDEIEMIKFFRQPLKPYWRRNGAKPADLFQAAERDYVALIPRCETFDKALVADAVKVGGAEYGQICALAYRQCLAGHGIAADPNGQPLMFTKENTSNGDIATADVIFPADPQLLLLSPTLAKATLAPLLIYAESDHWRFPNAPHDLGTYPIARGTDDGGEQMPVEESGNFLILCDAICQIENSTEFVDRWWPQLTKWTAYLEQFGLDPGDQLCTDDFMGHLAHNSNLSIKAILALAAYGDMCRIKGDAANAQRYNALAKQDVAHWVKVAVAGDHSLLAFDKPGTWSQKYNLVWDKILKLNIFPAEVAEKEVAFYKTVLQPYGLPLDSRTKTSKADWTIWSATLADKQTDFEALIAPLMQYLNHTKARSAFADSYETNKVDSVGMHARPVIGGVFIKMLADRPTWQRWASLDKTKTGNWAQIPAKPKLKEIIPTAQRDSQMWRYTTERPATDWMKPGFNDSQWKEGKAAFGNRGPSHTDWKTSDIWIRRTWTIPQGDFKHLVLDIFHDEDVEIYFNATLAAKESGYVDAYDTIELTPEGRALVKPGATIVVSAHCHQTIGGQVIDFGLSEATP